MDLLFSITGLKWEALGKTFFFLLSDNLIVLMLPAIYTRRKGKGNESGEHRDPDLEQQTLRKVSGRSVVAGVQVRRRRSRKQKLTATSAGSVQLRASFAGGVSAWWLGSDGLIWLAPKFQSLLI